MTRCICTVLLRHGIDHVVHQGCMSIDGIGKIPLHYWIELQNSELVDLRAQMWLGHSEWVPHGVFKPTPRVTYQSTQQIDPWRFSISEPIFSILAGIPLDHFTICGHEPSIER